MSSLFQKFFRRKRRIEVFSRHCIFSEASHHKERFSSFSREKCYRNLLETIDPRVNVTFFLDGRRADHFLRDEKTHEVIEVEAKSEAKSFLKLLETVEKRGFSLDTILYFVEDDYLHRDGWVDILLEGFEIPGIEYVTLYDHLDKYFFPEYETLTSKVFVTKSCHWRTVPSTTQTFGVRVSTFLRDLRIHQEYSENVKISRDHEKFLKLRERGEILISSIPGYSTHAEPKYASPLTHWEDRFK